MVGHRRERRRKVLEDVKRILASDFSIKTDSLTEHTRIVEDLKLDGDDGIEFVDSFHNEYPFESSGFNYADYFGSEGLSLGILDWIRGRKALRRRPLTIGMLIDAAVNGKWTPPS